MKTIKKIFLFLIFIVIIPIFCVSCGQNTDVAVDNPSSYEVYLAYADNGGELSYEEWLAGIKGEKGEKGEPGEKGADGHTPSIGSNGHWWVGGVDTGIDVNGLPGERGEKGDQGNGILSIEKTSSDELVDTYTITFTDGKTTTFTVTNGEKGEKGERGEQGLQGIQGEQGLQGKQGLQGNQGVPGEKGDPGVTGQNGKSAYELYKNKFDYSGTEEEWLEDLFAGRLNPIDLFTVSFDTADGTVYPDQSVRMGETVEYPGIPERTGYTFQGWFYQDVAWLFPVYTVSKDMTLSAKWSANTYTISFDSNGGTSCNNLQVAYDSFVELPSPTKENAIFLGWYYNDICYASERWTKWTFAQNVTLTAHWKEWEEYLPLSSIDVDTWYFGEMIGIFHIDNNTLFLEYEFGGDPEPYMDEGYNEENSHDSNILVKCNKQFPIEQKNDYYSFSLPQINHFEYNAYSESYEPVYYSLEINFKILDANESCICLLLEPTWQNSDWRDSDWIIYSCDTVLPSDIMENNITSDLDGNYFLFNNYYNGEQQIISFTIENGYFQLDDLDWYVIENEDIYWLIIDFAQLNYDNASQIPYFLFDSMIIVNENCDLNLLYFPAIPELSETFYKIID